MCCNPPARGRRFLFISVSKDPNYIDFDEVVRLIVNEDPRYEPAAYRFVREVLEHTVHAIRRANAGKDRPNNHVTGRELMLGLKVYALNQFGPMTITVFDHWRVKTCADFGEIVFNLIDFGFFSKSDSDKREDFADVFDFHEAFVKPFEPQRRILPMPHILRPDPTAPVSTLFEVAG